MRILIDADACPVTRIAERVAREQGIPVVLLCDTNHVLTSFYSEIKVIAAVNDGGIDAAFPVGGGLYYSEVSGIYQSNAVVSAPTDLVYKGEYSEETTIASFAVNENNRMQYYYIVPTSKSKNTVFTGHFT